MLPEQKLDALLVRHKAVESELASALSPEIYVKLSREFAELGPVVETVKRYRGIVSEIDDLNALIEDPETDPEMRSMADAEKPQLEEQRAALEQEIKIALLPKDAMDERNVILEIRAGTGGDEAALFTGDLLRMYERYGAKQGGKLKSFRPAKAAWGAIRRLSRKFAAAERLPGSNSSRGSTAFNASPTPRPRDEFIPRRRPSPCCRKWLMSISQLMTPI
jgi:peptide chain release factor 1